MFIAKQLRRYRQIIYCVYHVLNESFSILDYYQRYKTNKNNCGRHSTYLLDNKKYIQKKVVQVWTYSVIVGCADFPSSCSDRTLYHLIRKDYFDASSLPTIGKKIGIKKDVNKPLKELFIIEI